VSSNSIDSSTARVDSERDPAAPSKTRRKQSMHDLQDIGERLVELSPERLDELRLPDSLRDAVIDARKITKHEARRRQMQFIGRLMRDVDAVPIRAAFARWDGQSADAVRALHGVERWRERLIDDDEALTVFINAHPSADIQAIRVAIRETRKERNAVPPRAPRHFRELFRLVRDAMQIDSSGGSS
jgi:ribosome-associated protein